MQSDKPGDESPMRTPMGVSPAAAAGLRPDVPEVKVEPDEAEIESNELHAGVGTICSHCGQKIVAGEDVRKTVQGAYVHENCPIPTS